MPKFKAFVKVPADSTNTLKRIVTKTISADNSLDALAQLRGQYGSKNVNITQKVMPGFKPRPRSSISTRRSYTPSRSYTPKASTSFSRRNSTYKYSKPTPNRSGKDDGAAIGALITGFVILCNFLLKYFNSLTLKMMFAIFGKNKVYYWAVNNKHALAFSLSSVNMMMLFLSFKIILIFFS
ncbi:hypothetical protein N9K34_02885 [Candidatus Pelagibacter bacterium]|nr:hypothetical protein [Candidatus Pelagibacter bacterium]